MRETPRKGTRSSNGFIQKVANGKRVQPKHQRYTEDIKKGKSI